MKTELVIGEAGITWHGSLRIFTADAADIEREGWRPGNTVVLHNPRTEDFAVFHPTATKVEVEEGRWVRRPSAVYAPGAMVHPRPGGPVASWEYFSTGAQVALVIFND